MAIKETTKKIHFMPVLAMKEVDNNPAPTVTISRKYGSMTFSSEAIREMGMRDKFIRFYFEPIKKVIGWQIRDIVRQDEMKTWKLVKIHPSKESWQAGIGKLLMQFDNRLKKEVYKKVPIQKYREINQLSEYKNQIFYFVELVDNPEELKKGVGNDKVGEMTTH